VKESQGSPVLIQAKSIESDLLIRLLPDSSLN